MVEAAARWTLCEVETSLLSTVGTPLTRMDYKDLVSSPRRALSEALTSLDLPLRWQDLTHVLDDGLVLPTSHGLSGNPAVLPTAQCCSLLTRRGHTASPGHSSGSSRRSPARLRSWTAS